MGRNDKIFLNTCCISLWPTNNNTIRTSDTVLRKIYLSLYWKGCVWEGVGDRTELNILTPTLMAISVSFPFYWAAQPGAWGPASLGTGFLYRILSLTSLVSKLPDFLSSLSYIIVPRPPSSWGRHNFAFIQPVHCQGYNILIIPRPDAPVIYKGAFSILTAQPGRRSIYNIPCSFLILGLEKNLKLGFENKLLGFFGGGWGVGK